MNGPTATPHSSAACCPNGEGEKKSRRVQPCAREHSSPAGPPCEQTQSQNCCHSLIATAAPEGSRRPLMLPMGWSSQHNSAGELRSHIRASLLLLSPKSNRKLYSIIQHPACQAWLSEGKEVRAKQGCKSLARKAKLVVQLFVSAQRDALLFSEREGRKELLRRACQGTAGNWS